MPLGTENIEKVIDVSLSLWVQTAAVLEDKKVTWMEYPLFIDELLQIPGVVSSWSSVMAELKDGVDEAERLKLHQKFAAKFDIPNDEIELWIEDALLWAISTVSLIGRAKALKAKKDQL